MSVKKIVILSIVGFLLLVIIAFALDFTGVWLWRYRLQLERTAIKQSHQYIEAKQSMLMQLYGEWIRGTPAQKIYLEQRMKLEASRIRKHEVPTEVLQIISRR